MILYRKFNINGGEKETITFIFQSRNIIVMVFYFAQYVKFFLQEYLVTYVVMLQHPVNVK